MSTFAHAKYLLEQQKKTVTEIVWVFPDAIWYLGAAGCKMTAWLKWDGAEVRVFTEPGFDSVFPPEFAFPS